MIKEQQTLQNSYRSWWCNTEEEVLEKKSAYHSYMWCKLRDTNRLEEHQQIVIDFGNCTDIMKFADYVPGANISKLEDAIIKIGNLEHIVVFASEIERSNKEKLFRACLAFNNIKYINWFLESFDLSEESKQLAIFI